MFSFALPLVKNFLEEPLPIYVYFIEFKTLSVVYDIII